MKTIILLCAIVVAVAARGYVPPPNPRKCPDGHHCAKYNAICKYHERFTDIYQCLCANGYYGDGKTCDKIVCNKPGPIDNGFFTKVQDTYDLGAVITYECERGYELINGETRTCVDNKARYGIFTPKAPECIDINECLDDPCGRNEDCTNTPGSYRCTCKNGYYDLDPSRDLNCVGICGIPMDLDNGNYVDVVKQSGGDTYLVGDTVQYECNDGYNLVGGDVKTCLGNMEFEDAPVCVPFCRTPRAPRNGAVVDPQREYDVTDYARYSCKPGYRLVGPSRTQCVDSLTWDPENPPVCEEILCGRPMIDTETTKFTNPDEVQDEYRPGESVDTECLPRRANNGGSDPVCVLEGDRAVWKGQLNCQYSCANLCGWYTTTLLDCSCHKSCMNRRGNRQCCFDYKAQCEY